MGVTPAGRPRLALASRGRFRAREPLVIIAGGGSVGHLAPGFAVAEALREIGVTARFLTPGERDEALWFPEGEAPPLRAPAPRLPRRPTDVPLFAPRLLHAIGRSLRRLDEQRPGVVLGLGGWPCVPAALAARHRRIPLALFASDATPGVAVRWLARLADRIYVAKSSAAHALERARSVRVTGPVLRPASVEGRRDPARFGLVEGRLTLLVTGGSLGARGLNERMARGLEAAVARRPDLASVLQVIHTVGRSEVDVAASYDRAGIRHHVTAFLPDMGTAYRTADLVVSRAGALTCAEIQAVGRPAILVPYPHHADRQQYANAEPLLEAEGALLVEEDELSVEGVQTHVLDLLDDAPRREAMAAAYPEAVESAAGQIAADLGRLLEKKRRSVRRAGGVPPDAPSAPDRGADPLSDATRMMAPL